MKGRKTCAKDFVLPILVVIWPLIYYSHFIVPGRWFSLQIGNDFGWFYYRYKVYLLDLLAAGRFPWWSPSEAAGFPFYSNPFTQAFYPLNAALLLFRKLFGGFSLFDYQAYSVLGVCVLALGLYLWLSNIVANKRAVLFAVLVMSGCYKVAEILRFPNAVHAAAWIPWVLYGITLAVNPERRVWATLVLFVSCLMLLTAGYPYYAYYCIFLVLPYIFVLACPWTRGAFTRAPPVAVNIWRYFAAAVIPPALAGLICSPYFYKMWQLMQQTVDRSGGNYEFSTAEQFGLVDTLGSLCFPPVASPEGWYYFSVLGLVLVALVVAILVLDRRAVDPLAGRSVWVVIVWIALISYISYGKSSYLFSLFWQVLPGFSELRVWGRLNIILVPLIALLLARAYDSLETFLVTAADIQDKRLGPARLFAGTVGHLCGCGWGTGVAGPELLFTVVLVPLLLVLSRLGVPLFCCYGHHLCRARRASYIGFSWPHRVLGIAVDGFRRAGGRGRSRSLSTGFKAMDTVAGT